MTTLREAAEKALDALQYGHFAVADQAPHAGVMTYLEATDNLREALAKPEPKPVAWTTMPDANDWTFVSGSANPNGKLNGKWYPLYATPPQRKPLTDEEIIKIWNDMGNDPIAPSVFSFIACVRKTEQAHGIE